MVRFWKMNMKQNRSDQNAVARLQTSIILNEFVVHHRAISAAKVADVSVLLCHAKKAVSPAYPLGIVNADPHLAF
jgi:hypothetical protein